tara:strand:+ start:182 stop:550 length:369 start_codon:yes stop_codon:yes gene_type:complete
MNFLIKLIVLFIIFAPSLNAETVTVKCYIDEEHSYSFLLDTEKKTVNWLDQNNQNMIISVFPNVDKGGYLLIMGGNGANNEKHTFIINVVKSIMSVTTNLGFSNSGKCGNKSIIEAKDPYAD